MKIENFSIYEFGKECEDSGNIYQKYELNFNKNKQYLGYIDLASAINNNTKMAMFMIDDLRIKDNWLIGNVNLINTNKEYEFISMFNNFSVSMVTLCEFNDENIRISAQIHSFCAHKLE